jgi:flagellin
MGMSVNTNAGAMLALQNLNKSNSLLEKTQLHITTGLKVNGPKEDAATYAIAQRMRGEIAGMSSVKTALSNAEATLNVAITAGKAIADILTEMKSKVVQGNQAGLDTASRTALNSDFEALRNQINTITESAEFNGVTLINGPVSSSNTFLSTVDGDIIRLNPTPVYRSSTLGLASDMLVSQASSVTALLSIDNAIHSVSSGLANLGSTARRIEVQMEFSTKLIDILKEGVGNLVNADLAEESANLQSLQIKQQLGVQALSIANSGPQSILSLFGR